MQILICITFKNVIERETIERSSVNIGVNTEKMKKSHTILDPPCTNFFFRLRGCRFLINSGHTYDHLYKISCSLW